MSSSTPHGGLLLYDPLMEFPETVPLKVAGTDSITPKSMVCPDNVPLTVPSLMQELLNVAGPLMVFPCWLNTTVKLPVLPACVLLV